MHENNLRDALARGQSGSRKHLEVVGQKHDQDTRLALVALDTNVLKRLRHHPLQAESLVTRLKANGTLLIVPSQALTEFWNNHNVFAKEEWSQVRTAFESFRKKAVAADPTNSFSVELSELDSILENIYSGLNARADPQFMQKSQNLVKTILQDAEVPEVSRVAFIEIAEARLRSKTPPGFADGTKVHPLGDFFVWADFLLGVMTVSSQLGEGVCLFATQESKPDWKTGGSGHPFLLAEATRITGRSVIITDLEGLESRLAAVTDSTTP